MEAGKRLGVDVQVSVEAALHLARALEAHGLSLAAATLEALRENNAERRRLRLSELVQVTAGHGEEALDIYEG